MIVHKQKEGYAPWRTYRAVIWFSTVVSFVHTCVWCVVCVCVCVCVCVGVGVCVCVGAGICPRVYIREQCLSHECWMNDLVFSDHNLITCRRMHSWYSRQSLLYALYGCMCVRMECVERHAPMHP